MDRLGGNIGLFNQGKVHVIGSSENSDHSGMA